MAKQLEFHGMAQNNKLSYSSATLLKNCSQKYFYYKVAGVKKDPDADTDQDHFNIGKAFHYVMEQNHHTMDRLDELLIEAVKSFEVEQYKAMIHAMLLRYLKVHQLSGLTAVKCELAIENDIFTGFIDVILMNPKTKEWWIGDLKTAGRWSDLTLARLPLDTQLNLYSYFSDDIAESLSLDPAKFKGARYRVTTKADLVMQKQESYEGFVKRSAMSIKSLDIPIPIKLMQPSEIYNDHVRLYAKAQGLRDKTVKPEKNLSYCDSFFKPCEYFSQCYGFTATKGKALPFLISEKAKK